MKVEEQAPEKKRVSIVIRKLDRLETTMIRDCNAN
jgi:hypothetical protein